MRSLNGSECRQSCPNTTPPPLRSGAEALARIGNDQTQLTAANLVKNNSFFANDLRKNQAPSKVTHIDLAAKSLGLELPAKTKQQLLESLCELGPIERLLKGTEDSMGGPVDEHFWNGLVERDPLAVEIEAVCSGLI